MKKLLIFSFLIILIILTNFKQEFAKKLQQEEILNDPTSLSEPVAHQNIYEESFYHDPDDDYSLAMYLQQQEQQVAFNLIKFKKSKFIFSNLRNQ